MNVTLSLRSLRWMSSTKEIYGYTQSGIEQNFWHECRHCLCGNDAFETLNSMCIMDNWNRAEIFGMSVDIANEDKIEYYPDLDMKMT